MGKKPIYYMHMGDDTDFALLSPQVIQEIFLANSVLVWADNVPLQFPTLHWAIDYFYLLWKTSPFAQFKLFTRDIPIPGSVDKRFEESRSLYQGVELVRLLAHFRHQQCEIPRDRIFSLLSMCKEGAAFHVDYDAPDIDVAIATTKHCDSRSVCLCTPFLVADCLQKPDSVTNAYAQSSDKGDIGPYFEIEVDGMSFHTTEHEMPELHKGESYSTRRLKSDWNVFDTIYFRGCCENFKKMINFLATARQVVRKNSSFSHTKQEYITKTTYGNYTSPLGEPLLLQPVGESEERDVAFPPTLGFSIEEKPEGTCVIRIAFSAIRREFLSNAPGNCAKFQLDWELDRSYYPSRIKMQVKHGRWDMDSLPE
jgi:hypothetical protein